MEKKKGQRAETYTTLDAYQAGWLTLKGHSPKLINQNGKVVFVFILTDTLLKDLADYNNGAVVEASRFAFAVKTLKSQIDSLRRNKESNYVQTQKKEK